MSRKTPDFNFQAEKFNYESCFEDRWIQITGHTKPSLSILPNVSPPNDLKLILTPHLPTAHASSHLKKSMQPPPPPGRNSNLVLRQIYVEIQSHATKNRYTNHLRNLSLVLRRRYVEIQRHATKNRYTNHLRECDGILKRWYDSAHSHRNCYQ